MKKKELKNLDLLFRERLITQLYNDFEIGEHMEIRLRSEMQCITFSPSNNNRKIIGTINSHKLTVGFYGKPLDL